MSGPLSEIPIYEKTVRLIDRTLFIVSRLHFSPQVLMQQVLSYHLQRDGGADSASCV